LEFLSFFVEKGPLSLRDFLKCKLPLSGRGIKRVLDRGWVFLNEERIFKAGAWVFPGDKVEVLLADYGRDYEVLYKDDFLLAVSKPPFLLTNESKDSLEALLNEDGYRVRAIHRLDSETSGVTLFAKGEEVFEAFKELFKNRAIDKIYKVIAEGSVKEDLFKVDFPIEGREAITIFKVLKRAKIATYLEAKLLTGRKHQIRIHLLKKGYPVVGDKLYRKGKIEEEALRKVPRNMIHCEKISFRHPFTGEYVQIVSPLPQDFVMTLKRLF